MLRFFVSSTFLDMHGERQSIHSHVLPRVQAFAAQLGEYVDICDLRWGMDLGTVEDEIAVRGKVMNICLDAIDDCDGYMICLLGDSYGTRMQGKSALLLERIWQNYHPTSHLKHYDISLTQLEIEHGLFNGDANKCLCYRRICANAPSPTPVPTSTSTPPSESDQQRQKNLIQRVATNGCSYSEYEARWDSSRDRATGLEDFEDCLYKELTSIILQKHKSHTSGYWPDAERHTAHAIAQELEDSFCGRASQIRDLVKLTKGNRSTICVYGNSGVGKSAFLAHWLHVNKLLDNRDCWYVFCGVGNRSKTVLDVSLQLIYYLKNILQEVDGLVRLKPDHIESQEVAVRTLRNLLRQCDAALEDEHRKIILVLDGVNQLYETYSVFNLYSLAGLSLDNITIVFSSIDKMTGMDENLRLSELNNDDTRQIVEKNMYHIDDQTYDALVGPILRKKHHGIPLYLRCIMSVLKMRLGSISAANNAEVFKHYRKDIEALPDDIEDLIWTVIREASLYVGEGITSNSAHDQTHLMLEDYQNYLGIIAESEFGVSDEDAVSLVLNGTIQHSQSRKEALFARITYCRLFLHSLHRHDNEGRWSFSHDLVYNSVTTHVDQHKSRHLLCNYASRLEPSQGITHSTQKTLLFFDVMHSALALKQYQLIGSILQAASSFVGNGQDGESICGLVTQSANRFIEENQQEGLGCFKQLVQEYAQPLESVLTHALTPEQNHVDANRRVIAVTPARVFYESVRERCSSRMDELGFNWFLKQLIDIYDDISRQRSAIDLMDCACNYLMKVHLEDYQSTNDKNKLIALANLTFFCSNKLLHDNADEGRVGDVACKISEAMLEWYQREIQGHDGVLREPELADRCGAFTNNIGQRYNATRDVDKGFPYRLAALLIKAPPLLEYIRNKNAIPSFNEICAWPSTSDPCSHMLLFQRHVAFWSSPDMHRVIAANMDDGVIKRAWQSIALTYRALGTDYYYWPDIIPQTNPLDWYNIGYKYLSFAISLMNDYGMEPNKKELAVTRIRLAGMATKRYSCLLSTEHDSNADLDELHTIFDSAITAYWSYSRFDYREARNLKDNLLSASSTLSLSADLAHAIVADELKVAATRLKRMIDEEDKQNADMPTIYAAKIDKTRRMA